MPDSSRGFIPLAATLLVLLLPGRAVGQEEESDVPYVPTPLEVVREMLELADPSPSDSLYDLGSGDGRIVITAAKEHGTPGVGVDIDPDRVREARQNAREEGVADRVRFVRGDLFELDISPATVVTLYLLPSVNRELRPKLLEELRPGTRVVSHAFGMGEWEPDSTVHVREEEGARATVHYWIIPARVAGTWKLTAPGGETYRLRLEQEYQEVHGTAVGNGNGEALEGVRLRGDSISFSLDLGSGEGATRLRGRVSGDRMDGVTDGGRGWSARRLEGEGTWRSPGQGGASEDLPGQAAGRSAAGPSSCRDPCARARLQRHAAAPATRTTPAPRTQRR